MSQSGLRSIAIASMPGSMAAVWFACVPDPTPRLTSGSGIVAYTGAAGGLQESMARVSIASLVYSLARRKDLPQFKATMQYLVDTLESTGQAKFNLPEPLARNSASQNIFFFLLSCQIL